MECDQFRQLVGADPATIDGEAEQHARNCPACNAYAERLHVAERLIGEALRFDVQELQQNFEQSGRSRHRNRLPVIVGTAAAMVAVIAVWVMVGPGANGALAADVAEHWYHEPSSWHVTEVRVSDVDLGKALEDIARLDLSKLGPVTYVHSCWFRGHFVPHLVIQGAAGPVMVLLLPGEPVRAVEAVTVPEEGLAGVIIPHGRGSIAVLGTVEEPLEPMQQSLLDAVEWSI